MLKVCSPIWVTQPADDLADLGGVDAGALDRGALHGAEQVGGVDGRQAAVAPAERRADGLDDDDVGVGERAHVGPPEWLAGGCWQSGGVEAGGWAARLGRNGGGVRRMVPPVTLATMRRSAMRRHRIAAFLAPALARRRPARGVRRVRRLQGGRRRERHDHDGRRLDHDHCRRRRGDHDLLAAGRGDHSTQVDAGDRRRLAPDRGADGRPRRAATGSSSSSATGRPPGTRSSTSPDPSTRANRTNRSRCRGAPTSSSASTRRPASTCPSPTANPTYTGPRTLTDLGLAHAVEVVNSEDFEGILTWVIGLDGQRPFTVSTLSSPPRVVVDVS